MYIVFIFEFLAIAENNIYLRIFNQNFLIDDTGLKAHKMSEE